MHCYEKTGHVSPPLWFKKEEINQRYYLIIYRNFSLEKISIFNSFFVDKVLKIGLQAIIDKYLN